MKRAIMKVAVVALVLWVGSSVVAEEREVVIRTEENFSRGGRDGAEGTSRPRDIVAVDRFGRAVSGKLMVGTQFEGFDGSVQWEETGASEVFGTILDARGGKLGTFEGHRAGRHIFGVATFLDGRTVSWSWNEKASE